jgi:hypothetical protein
VRAAYSPPGCAPFASASLTRRIQGYVMSAVPPPGGFGNVHSVTRARMQSWSCSSSTVVPPGATCTLAAQTPDQAVRRQAPDPHVPAVNTAQVVATAQRHEVGLGVAVALVPE